MQLPPSGVPLPVEHDLETPPKVAQLAMLELRAASRLMRMTQKMRRPIHFDCYLHPVLQSNEHVDAVPGGLATMLLLCLDTARKNFTHHVGLHLRRPPFFRDEGAAAGQA